MSYRGVFWLSYGLFAAAVVCAGIGWGTGALVYAIGCGLCAIAMRVLW